MQRKWHPLPPLLERTLRDDLVWAFAVLAGVTLVAALTGRWFLLLGAVAGATIVIVVLNVVRRLVRHRRA